MREIYTYISFCHFAVHVYETLYQCVALSSAVNNAKALDKMYLYEIHHINIPTFVTGFTLHSWHAPTF